MYNDNHNRLVAEVWLEMASGQNIEDQHAARVAAEKVSEDKVDEDKDDEDEDVDPNDILPLQANNPASGSILDRWDEYDDGGMHHNYSQPKSILRHDR